MLEIDSIRRSTALLVSGNSYNRLRVASMLPRLLARQNIALSVVQAETAYSALRLLPNPRLEANKTVDKLAFTPDLVILGYLGATQRFDYVEPVLVRLQELNLRPIVHTNDEYLETYAREQGIPFVRDTTTNDILNLYNEVEHMLLSPVATL